MPFDVQGAKAAGYPDAEIADHLAQQSNFDAQAARAAGYSDAELIGQLAYTSTGIPQPSQYDPSAGMSPTEQAVAGASSQVRAMGRGIRDAVTNAAMIGSPYRQQVDMALRKQEDARRRLDAPLMANPAAQRGAVAGSIAATIPAMAIPGGQTVLGSALIGGAMGLSQPVGSNDSRLSNAGRGAAFGAAVPAAFTVAGKMLRPVGNTLSAEGQGAVDALTSEGVPLSVAQRTGSRAAQSVERNLSDNPITAPVMDAQLFKRKLAFTRAALRTVGETADKATPTVLNSARTRIGGVMDTVASHHSLDINDPAALNELASIADEAGRILSDGGKQIHAQIDRITAKAAANGGKLDGATYQQINSELGQLSQQPYVGEYANQVKEVLDDSLQRAAQGTNDYAKLREARSQWRNLQAIAASTDKTVEGLIQPGALAQRLSVGRYTKNSFRYGTGDTQLSNLARNMNSVLDKFPNSGTASRAASQAALPAIAGGVDYALERDPVKAAKWAALGWGGPRLAAALIHNPATANYLANGAGVQIPQNALVDFLRRSGQLAGPALIASQPSQ